MSMTSENFSVALTTCYLCGEGSDILINTRLQPKYAKAVEELDGKVITKEPCQKCKEYQQQGIILITIRDPKPGQKEEDYYRTGGFFVIKEEAFKRVMQPSELLARTLEKRAAFIPNDLAYLLGLCEEGSLHE